MIFSFPMIKDSTGKPSLTATMAAGTWLVMMVQLLLGGSAVHFGESVLAVPVPDSEMVAALGIMILGYLGRRHTSMVPLARFAPAPKPPAEPQDPEATPKGED